MPAHVNAADSPGRLAENLLNFARTLRAAGLPVGPGKVLDAVAAVQAVGITGRQDFYWALHAVFVNRREQRPLFDQAFHVFWRNPRLLERLTTLLMPELATPPAPVLQQTVLPRRLADALAGGAQPETQAAEREIEQDATETWSARETLGQKDFETMSAAELAEAKALIRRMRLGLATHPVRRFTATGRGERIDLRGSLRQSLRSGGDLLLLQRKSRRKRPPPVVLLCDISGSMSRYSRMLLHFAHALSNDRDRVFTFVFGTRLTNISRQLRFRDVDQALDRVSEAVADWQGGTCIGRCIHRFNRDWSRRVLAQGAVVLLISDGLDRDETGPLRRAMERLQKSCRRLIWLNPLLRYHGFEPKAQGVRAILPHVDEFRTVHNLDSLSELGVALDDNAPADPGTGVKRWLQMLH